jgi:hypothetical protein
MIYKIYSKIVTGKYTVKILYLFLAIIGAVVPMLFFANFFQTEAPLNFIDALFVNGAAGGFSADLLITSLVFWLHMWTHKHKAPNPVPFIVLNLFIGLSCAFPAYLYMLARQHEATATR